MPALSKCSLAEEIDEWESLAKIARAFPQNALIKCVRHLPVAERQDFYKNIKVVKSVAFTDEGLERSERLLQQLFGKGAEPEA